MVSPGTHLVNSHKSLSITSESQLKKTKSPELKMLGMGLLTRQLIWRQTPKLFIYSPSIFLMHKKTKINRGFETIPKSASVEFTEKDGNKYCRLVCTCTSRKPLHRVRQTAKTKYVCYGNTKTFNRKSGC